MASPCEILLDGRHEKQLRRAAQAAIVEVRRIESKYSRYRSGSVVSRINAAAGQAQPIAIDDETAALLGFADQLWHQSDGRFDATSGVLRRVWDFKQGKRPSPQAVQAVLPLVNWTAVERQGAGVRLSQPGMELDFGGFGKEYAADRAAAMLLAHEVEHALVNLGGDIHVLGPRGLPELQSQAWQVAIQHPRPGAGAPDAVLAHLSVARGALATSGDYERFFVHEGIRYCHVFNARTGWPVTHWQSISVLAPNTTAAGALSTLAMLQADQAIAWLDTQQARYLAVDYEGTVYRSGAVP